MQSRNVIVVGLGAMGSAALFALARRGVHALGFDRFEPPHTRGSSHGESRVFRMAYFEGDEYVPLLRLASEHWRKLEADTGQQVLRTTGILEAGYKGSPLVARSLASAIKYRLDHTILAAHEVNRQYPAFSLPADWDCVHQPDGGILFPEKIIRLYLDAASKAGARVRFNTPVRNVLPVADGVEVILESGEVIGADSAILAAGPWMPNLLPALARKLTLTRQPTVWFRPRQPIHVLAETMPVFILQTPNELRTPDGMQTPGEPVYGLPDLLGTGVKFASHHSGGKFKHADDLTAEVSDDEQQRLLAMLQRYVPAAAGVPYRTQTCIYTRTEAEHFVLGPHPKHPQLIIASACSGHGFKFASILGEVLADYAISGDTGRPVGLFDPKRYIDA